MTYDGETGSMETVTLQVRHVPAGPTAPGPLRVEIDAATSRPGRTSAPDPDAVAALASRAPSPTTRGGPAESAHVRSSGIPAALAAILLAAVAFVVLAALGKLARLLTRRS